MAIVVKRQDGTVANLDASAVALGVNTSQRIGRQLEVTGFILSRTTEEAGVAATAVAFAAEGPDMGHIAINDNYDPDRPTRNWKRTMTFANGNVGIGTGFGAGQPPAARLTVQGDIAVQNAGQQTTITLDGALGDIILANGDCAEEFDVAADVQPDMIKGEKSEHLNRRLDTLREKFGYASIQWGITHALSKHFEKDDEGYRLHSPVYGL